MDVEDLAAPPDLVERRLDILIDSVLTAGEKADVLSMCRTEQIRGFLRLWTIKEALLKALGTGLSLDLSTLEVPAGMRRGASCGVFRFPDSPETAWRVADIGRHDFVAAVAWS